jgi:hypothetical protein
MDSSHSDYLQFFDEEFEGMLDLFAKTELEYSKRSLQIMENILKLV